jgi:hypothetical protein
VKRKEREKDEAGDCVEVGLRLALASMAMRESPDAPGGLLHACIGGVMVGLDGGDGVDIEVIETCGKVTVIPVKAEKFYESERGERRAFAMDASLILARIMREGDLYHRLRQRRRKVQMCQRYGFDSSNAASTTDVVDDSLEKSGLQWSSWQYKCIPVIYLSR